MRSSITTTVLDFSPTMANLSPRQSTPSCCFQLVAVGDLNAVVEEGQLGDLLLGGSSQEASQAGFCLDTETRVVKDGLGNSCYFQAPEQQFKCSVGSFWATSFDTSEPDTHGLSYLTYNDGNRRFHACPSSSASDKSYYIYSDDKPDTTGCFEITLSLADEAAECHARNMATTIPSPSQPMTTVSSATSTESMKTLFPPTTRPMKTEEALMSTTTASSTSETLTSSRTCIVPSSSSSIAPSRVGYPDPDAPDGIHDSASEVSISPKNSTIFEYIIPPSFLPMNSSHGGAPPLCALQFRMPVCTELPKGYPCYDFSGLEQEILAESGINFNLTVDDGTTTWDDAALHQVFPGEDSIIGTFECGIFNGSYGGGRKIRWKATSVRNFSLEFLHAGVGEDPEFRDGIGAWIVPCL